MDDFDDYDWHALRTYLVVYSVGNIIEGRSDGVRTVYTDDGKGARQTQQLREAATDRRIFNFTRLRGHIFKALLERLMARGHLKDGRKFSDDSDRHQSTAAEKLVIFLHMVATGLSYRQLQEVFQHSMATITAAIHEAMVGLFELHVDMVKLPDQNTPASEEVQRANFWPFFKDCVGALDGSHVPAYVTGSKIELYRNRHGYPSQNILVACNFDGQFIYVYPG